MCRNNVYKDKKYKAQPSRPSRMSQRSFLITAILHSQKHKDKSRANKIATILSDVSKLQATKINYMIL